LGFIGARGPDERIKECAPSRTATDARGSVIATSDENGDVRNQYAYSPYGVSNDDSGIPFRYTDQKLDIQSGLYYYKARWYDPEVGRFLQPDPIGYSDGINLYAYVGGDPVNSTDPTGLMVDEVIAPGSCNGRCNDSGGQAGFSGGGAGGGGERGSDFNPNTVTDRIVVRARRRSRVTARFSWNPLTIFGHENSATNDVCADGSNVSNEQLAETFRSFIVPKLNPQPVEDGDTSIVTSPVTTIPITPGRMFPFSVPGGRVRTAVASNGLSGTNQTTIFHLFHDGTVDRVVSRQSNGAISVATTGQGTNYLLILAALNVFTGPLIFEELDRQFAQALADQFPECSFQ